MGRLFLSMSVDQSHKDDNMDGGGGGKGLRIKLPEKELTTEL